MLIQMHAFHSSLNINISFVPLILTIRWIKNTAIASLKRMRLYLPWCDEKLQIFRVIFYSLNSFKCELNAYDDNELKNQKHFHRSFPNRWNFRLFLSFLLRRMHPEFKDRKLAAQENIQWGNSPSSISRAIPPTPARKHEGGMRSNFYNELQALRKKWHVRETCIYVKWIHKSTFGPLWCGEKLENRCNIYETTQVASST